MALVKIVAVSMVLGGLAAGQASAEEKLSTRAIKQLFPGQFHAIVKGYKVVFTAKRDGSLIGNYNSAKDTGRWSVSRGRLCIMLKDWMDGKTSCSTVVRNQDWYTAKQVKFRKL
ncbi:MAG: hypothetical protein OER56_10750 [Hyphomicrobiales bacterium]|nr:hypothetical protein [Hyphomicrobiales bacterium]